MLPSFPSNAYADHCLLLDSDVILPSKLPPTFFSFSPSFDYFLGGHDQENELHLLTQSFNCSSLDHSARRVPAGVTNGKSMAPQADGVAVLSFPNDTSTAGHGTPCTGVPTNFDHPNNDNNNNNNKADCNKEIIKNIFVAGDHQQRKRSGKKDRHSKIVTAQGPRDRRMRLSLDIARRFFDLQDRLGYDKASKTVEWLMSKSKGAIKEVMQGLLHPKEGPCGGRSFSSYTSDCDDTSGVEETPIDYNEDADLNEQNYPLPIITSTPKSRKNKAIRKPTFILPHGKEFRAMARARARERTKEKQSRRMEIGHEKKTTTATTPTTNTSRYHPHLEQQGLHFDYQQQTITPIAINNPDVDYNFIHQDWAAHGGIRY